MKLHHRQRPRRIAATPTLVGIKRRQDQRREEAEAFVRWSFARAYGAEVQRFLPLLLGLRNADDQLLAVLGMRHADSALFLEQYLRSPVERALAAASAGPVMRAQITEVGNLAVAGPGGGRWLIAALTAYLYGIGQQWVVFTCGVVLRNTFERMGVELLDLGVADPARLSADEAARWGRYYEQRPRVMAGNVGKGHRAILQSLDATPELRHLWHGAALAACAA